MRARAGRVSLRAMGDAAWLRPALLLVIIVALWALAVQIFNIPAYLIPRPLDVAEAMVDQWQTLLAEAVPTTLATLGGFALSVTVGIPLAMLIAGSRTVESYVYPLLVFSQSVPKVAIAPLLVVWFGFGMMPKVLTAFLLGVFPIVVSGVQGFKSVDPEMRDLVRSMRADWLQSFAYVNLPQALPSIFSGLKVSVTLAVVGAVVGEFVGANSGIGFVLQRSIGNFELPTMFAALVILALIGVILFWLIELVERVVVPWQASRRVEVAATA
ncbi:ABC transporter permease [Mangrovibrevibacter kandeliae]|uniref:ABC transporter permease n=1 Tax=Mangrovibrevibacter kandeliae TaxID=2968473 RepID=UPI00211922B3|nr:ABC transporter permease [Aurantimonas sp. MSK8Z-1]